MGDMHRFLFGASVAAVASACAQHTDGDGASPTSPESADSASKPTLEAATPMTSQQAETNDPEIGSSAPTTPLGTPAELAPLAPDDEQSGIQLGDDGSSTNEPPICGGGYGITDPSTRGRKHPLTLGEWLATVEVAEEGFAFVHINLDDSCTYELPYRLELDTSDASFWRITVGSEEQNGQCVAPEEYTATDVHLTLWIDGQLAAAVDVEARSDTSAGTTTLRDLAASDWVSSLQSTASATLGALQERCRNETSPENSSSTAGDGGVEVTDAGTLNDSGTAVEGAVCVSPTSDSGLSPSLCDCGSCLRSGCGVPGCETEATCREYVDCMVACGSDEECWAACGDPYCDVNDGMAGCYLLDCRTWGNCAGLCGAEPSAPSAPSPSSAYVRELSLTRAWSEAQGSEVYEGYLDAGRFTFELRH